LYNFTMVKPILISGIQPTGRLHVGNYLGALKNFVDLQNSGEYTPYFLAYKTYPQQLGGVGNPQVDLYLNYYREDHGTTSSLFE